ncbi:GTPase, G3E family [Pedobacter steynii]|uniref:GTPase, G3E family n=1 Tax=Pedobacter steynii TaxID=430522 RepID=A0A1H0BE38_9SPHI|nr:GTP-binding protein [Pedobacter steynii]NQX41079.1 GTP-binding protein [Pedobacter steynii]SDN43899.1 GTPase, G3E family [Pedobacter steynii]
MKNIKEVSILTGFLGSGKTTLVNAIISGRAKTRFAIIENEIGEESIDAELLIKGDDNIVELNNGCLCCTLNDNLYDILNQLWLRKSSWDQLLIEATGIADPANIARPFLTNESVQESFQLKRVICVVDAELIEDQLKETEVAIQQIAFSDVILLNKSEKVSSAYLRELQAILKTLNPFAEILVALENDFKIDILFNRERFANFYSNPKPFLTPKGMFNLIPAESEAIPQFGLGSAHRQHQHSGIETILLRYPENMNIEAIQHRMMVFLLTQSIGVYRIKGILFNANYPERVILQTVGKGMSVSKGHPWLEGDKKENKIVIIGKRLSLYGFDRMFRSCLEA